MTHETGKDIIEALHQIQKDIVRLHIAVSAIEPFGETQRVAERALMMLMRVTYKVRDAAAPPKPDREADCGK